MSAAADINTGLMIKKKDNITYKILLLRKYSEFWVYLNHTCNSKKNLVSDMSFGFQTQTQTHTFLWVPMYDVN